MFPLNLFKKKVSSIQLSDVNSICKSTHLAKLYKSNASALQSDIIMQKKKELFISLDSLLKMIEEDRDFTLEALISKCLHISELTGKSSTTTIYAIPDEDGQHITLCADAPNCLKHKDYLGDKLEITMVKKQSHVK